MRRIRIQNAEVNRTYKTFLGADYSSGTSLTVLNNASFAANDIILVGEPSEELSEAKKVNSTTGSTILTLSSAFNFSHNKGASIYKIYWDYVSIESSPTVGGTWSVISLSPIQWDNKLNETVYYDPSGTDAYSYRFRFYNSVTSLYSEYSPTLLGTGFSDNQIGGMINHIRKMVNDIERKIVQDDDIMYFLNIAKDIAYARNPRFWFLLVDTWFGQNPIPVIANQRTYSLSQYSDFGHMDTLRYNYNSGNSLNILYHLKRIPQVEFDFRTSNQNFPQSDYLEAYKLIPSDATSSAGYIQVDPKPKTTGVGNLYPYYYKIMPKYTTVDQTCIVPLPEILESFAISKIEKIKGDENKAKMYEDLFFGPADDAKDRSKLTGLPLLDDLDRAHKTSQGQPRSLSNYRGASAIKKFFGTINYDRDMLKENYW